MSMTTRWVIVASGPSLTKEDCDLTKSENVIAINDNYRMVPWAKILYACDGHWWDWHHEDEELKAFRGRKITQDEEAAKKYGLEYIKSHETPGLCQTPWQISQGNNSGIQAINLAYHLGAKQIILLGYDLQARPGKPRWFGYHPNEQDIQRSHWSNLNDNGKHRYVRYFDSVAEDAKKLGMEIINCSRGTALTCFPRMSLEQALSAAPAQA